MRVQPFAEVFVSIPEQSMSPNSIKNRKAPKQQIVKTAPSVTPLSDNANTAFDRIEIPQDAIQQISASHTGLFTDHIRLRH